MTVSLTSGEIYEELLNRYNLVPEECVFLDDLERNLKGAEKYGIHTILFTGKEEALDKLKEIGVFQQKIDAIARRF
mgnify:CR=1 FL=1